MHFVKNLPIILMFFVLLVLLSSVALASGHLSEGVNTASQVVNQDMEQKANLLEHSPFDMTTTVMLIVWTALIFMFKDKMQAIAIIGGWALILYARGFLGVV